MNRKTVMITGSTGLICSAIVDVLIRYNEKYNSRINIIAAGRDIEKIRKRFGYAFNREYFSCIEYDANSFNNQFPQNCDYIIHGASNAYPSAIIAEPVETMLSNIRGVNSILEYVRNMSLSNKTRVLYISSSEVYGNKTDNTPFLETEYGSVNILNARNSYAESKRAAETLCISFLEEYGIDTVIVRPGHIYGPTASRKDNRVSSMWAYSVAKGDDIIMKSEGLQIRSYTHCLDCATAILVVMLKGKSGESYNVSNRNSIVSIVELAELMSNIGGVNLVRDIATDDEKKSYNTMMNSSLDSNKIEALGWKGYIGIKEGVSNTIEILSELYKKRK